MAIDSIDHSLAARNIAGMALRTLLDVERKQLEQVPESSPPVHEVIEKLATDVRADIRQLDRASLTRLINAAADFVRSTAIGELRTKDVRDRLGSRGLLFGVPYVPEYSKAVLDTLPQKGLRRLDVDDTIAKPDAQQHLTPPEDLNNAPFLSLFVRVQNRVQVATEGAAAEWVLAIGRRVDQTVQVFAAFRIFQKDLEEKAGGGLPLGDARPLDLLSAFAETFGFPLKIGDAASADRRFVVYEVVEKNLLQWQAPSNARFDLQMNVRLRPDGASEVAVAFVIDMDKYQHSLISHGFEVPPRLKNPMSTVRTF